MKRIAPLQISALKRNHKRAFHLFIGQTLSLNKYFRSTTIWVQDNAGQRNRFLNTLYCSLCGKKTHRASDSCYAMRDDSGRVVNVTPSQVPCTICEKKINKKPYHPLKHCFNRPRNNTRTNAMTRNYKPVHPSRYMGEQGTCTCFVKFQHVF